MVTVERRFTPQEKVGSDAFRPEYKDVPIQVIIDDTISYLGEYRFNLPKYSYNFKFKNGKLRDPNRNESMVQASERAIDLRNRKGRSSVREKAEKIGFQSLNIQLANSKTGDTIIWASPPGPKEEGYGDYGFVCFGKVEGENFGEKNIKMTALRVEKPAVAQFKKAIYMLTGEKVDYEFAEEFLDSPRVVRQDLKEGYVDAILKMVFDFKPNEDEQEKFRKIIKKMFPVIYDFARNPLRKREDLYALENYALELKRGYHVYEKESPSRLKDLGVIYRNEPPKAAGSCGSTSSKDGFSSNNVFNSLSSINNLFSEDQEWFVCPKCQYEADGPIGNRCPMCGLTKEQYAEESGAEVCD